MFWFIVAGIGVIVLCFLFPVIRGVVTHPANSVYYGIKDPITWFKHKGWNQPPEGEIDVYAGLFGSGKTLSATSRVRRLYKRFNGKMLYIPEYDKTMPIKVHIISNVDLQDVPYQRFTSMQQIVDWQAYSREHRNEYCYFLCDEASSVLNSRSFRDNMNYFSINAMLTCRHSHSSLILTSQRFGQIDKLCREVCQRVYQCRKVWRILIHDIYDAYELENVANPLSIKPKATKVTFCTDAFYRGYDTRALVKQIEKDCKDGNMRTDEEILAAVSADPALYSVPEKRVKKEYRQKTK